MMGAIGLSGKRNILVFGIIYALYVAFIYSVAEAAVYTRQHSDTIVSDENILASDINDELDAIAVVVNGIDSGNITDNSILYEDHAATSSAKVNSRKHGCKLSLSGSTVIQINPPCDIVHNSLRGTISATASVNLTDDIDTGAAATGTNYFVYGAANSSAGIDFQISATEPEIKTRSKIGDSTKRYIGSFRSDNSTATNIVDFIKNGVKTIFNISPTTVADQLDSQTLGSSQTLPGTYWESPGFVRELLFNYEIDASSFPAICRIVFGNNPIFVVEANANDYIVNTLEAPVWVLNDVNRTRRLVQYQSVSNCNNVRLMMRGWIEPLELHQ